jgi:hypothetical protein
MLLGQHLHRQMTKLETFAMLGVAPASLFPEGTVNAHSGKNR